MLNNIKMQFDIFYVKRIQSDRLKSKKEMSSQRNLLWTSYIPKKICINPNSKNPKAHLEEVHVDWRASRHKKKISDLDYYKTEISNYFTFFFLLKSNGIGL